MTVKGKVVIDDWGYLLNAGITADGFVPAEIMCRPFDWFGGGGGGWVGYSSGI